MDYDIEEQQEDLQDVQQEVYEAQADDVSNIPTAKRTQDLYSLFDKVRKTDDSIKVSNVEKHELGQPKITIRDANEIALIGRTFHHKKFAEFFKERGEIILASSASKKGWFVDLFVTNKRFSTKSKGDSSNPQEKKKWSMFNKPQQQVD